jgi:hypothetical protein
MKQQLLALTTFLCTLCAFQVHAQQDQVIGQYGIHVYVMVPTDKAGDRNYVRRAAEHACASKSLDRPEGVPPHPRYEENKLAQFQRNRNAGVEASFAANCRLFKKDINVPCLTGTD